jgi:DNA-binding NarL/FixJ family response regulator
MAAELEVVVADDSDHFRRGLTAVLSAEPDIRVVGEAATGDELVELVEELAPDAALVDLRMPGGGGVAAIGRIRRVSPVTRVIVLTVSDDDEDLLSALVAGAHGYLLKDTAIERVARALHEAAQGGSPLSPAAASTLWVAYASLLQEVHQATDRERRVLQLLTRGVEPGAIARDLDLEPQVVAHELLDIAAKADLASRFRVAGR